MYRPSFVPSFFLIALFAGQVLAQSPEAADAQDRDLELEALKRELIDVTPGFYLSPILSLGYVAGETEIAQANINADFDGFLVRGGGAAGYQVDILRAELEVAVGHADIEIDDLNQKQDVTFLKFSANSFIDIPYDLSTLLPYDLPETLPYAGFGVGGIVVDFKGGDTDEGLIAEANAGLGIRLSPRWFVDAGYRLTYLPSIENQGADNEILLHGAEAKLRYRF
ncbi:MAG: outer membrane protein [Geminicoccaceae bacterium]